MILQGGDTDTNACIVGGIIGAAVGLSHIPEFFSKTMLECDTKGIRPRPGYLIPGQSNILKLVDKIWAKAEKSIITVDGFSDYLALLASAQKEGAEAEGKVEAHVDQKVEANVEKKVEANIEQKVEAHKEQKVEAQVEQKVEAHVEQKVEAHVEQKVEAHVEQKEEAHVEQKVEAQVGESSSSKPAEAK